MLTGAARYQVLSAAMRKLLSEMWSLDEQDVTKQARYERCLFQATLELGDEQARDVLAEIARHLDEVSKLGPEVLCYLLWAGNYEADRIAIVAGYVAGGRIGVDGN